LNNYRRLSGNSMMTKLLLIFFLFAPCLFAQEGVYIKKSNDRVAIGNRYIERVISVSPKHIGTIEIVNKLSGKTYEVKDDVFALQIVFSGLGPAPGEKQNGENDVTLTAKDFQFMGYKESDLNNGGKELTLNFKFDWEMTEFWLKANYEIDSARFSLRKWIEISDSSYGIQFLDRISVESMTFDRADFSNGAFGQPVLNGDIFLGIEYPTVENSIDKKSVRMGYVVGQEIKKEPFVSHASIIGASPSKIKLENTFMDYVDGIKVEGTRPFLLYNSWYDLRNPAIVKDSVGVMNEQSVLGTIDAFREHLYDKYHIALNAFVLDDAWDNYKSLWGIDSTRFPHGFTPFVDALRNMNTSLGLWASPFCGYSNRDIRVDWGAAHGYEKTGDFLCFAGAKYKAAFKQVMDNYAKEYSLGYFKWDGFLLSCNDPDHGHLPGIYSREANVATYIEMMQSVREINPKIYLNITSGTWLSPWWLKYADCIWMQGEDYGYQESVPSMTDRDKAITYKDAVLWDNFQKMHLLFPMSSLMTHGIIKGRFNLLGGENESQDSFDNEVMMYFGRGVMMWELYITPDLLSSNEWNAIASSVQWAKANQTVLEKTKMVLGNPLKKEVYGYVHLTKEKGILLFRNPNIAKQTVNLRLTPDLGDIDPSTKYYVKVIYPYNLVLPRPVEMNGKVTLNLDGDEVLAAELIRADKIDKDLPVGVKYFVENGKLIIYGENGKKENIRSVGGKNLGNFQFGTGARRIDCMVKYQVTDDGTKLSCHTSIKIPENYTHAKFALLLEPDVKLQNQLHPDFKIKVNGINKAPSVEEGDGSWFWVTADMDSGQDSVDCSVLFKEKAIANVSTWVMADQQLVGHTVDGIEIPEGETLPAKPFPASIQKELIPVAKYKIQ
jgi:hypothetical protein